MDGELGSSFVADLHIHSPYAFCLQQVPDSGQPGVLGPAQGHRPAGDGRLYASRVGGRPAHEPARVRVTASTNTKASGSCPAPRSVACTVREGARGASTCWRWCPPWKPAAAFTRRLDDYGTLESDGRPTVSLSARQLLETALDCCPGSAGDSGTRLDTMVRGCTARKPGSIALRECFGDLAPEIRAVESGLSSDPAMNRAVPELAKRSVVSFSDAHSPANLGREVTAFSWAADVGRVDDRSPCRRRRLHGRVLPGGRKVPLQWTPQVRRGIRHRRPAAKRVPSARCAAGR